MELGAGCAWSLELLSLCLAAGPKKSSGSASPCRSELRRCNSSAWGLLPSSVSPADVSGSSADGVQSFRAVIHSLTLVPDKSGLAFRFLVFIFLFYFIYRLTP